MDVVVTIPRSVYKNDDQETIDMQENSLIQFWTFRRLPAKLNVGDRIYFIKNNHIESSMRIIEISQSSTNQCQTTGRVWEGHIVYMDDLRYENLNINIKGFMGFRYRWWED
jgi:hypothetical protein